MPDSSSNMNIFFFPFILIIYFLNVWFNFSSLNFLQSRENQTSSIFLLSFFFLFFSRKKGPSKTLVYPNSVQAGYVIQYRLLILTNTRTQNKHAGLV